MSAVGKGVPAHEHRRAACGARIVFLGIAVDVGEPGCGLHDDFRNFRPDRMTNPVVTEATFDMAPGRNLTDFLARECDDALIFGPPP